MDANRMEEHVCAQCKKLMVRLSFCDYAYKKEYKSRLRYFCSWSCMRAFEKETEEADARKGNRRGRAKKQS